MLLFSLFLFILKKFNGILMLLFSIFPFILKSFNGILMLLFRTFLFILKNFNRILLLFIIILQVTIFSLAFLNIVLRFLQQHMLTVLN